MPLILAAAVGFSFGPVLWNGFVNWDDDANLTSNEAFRGLSPGHLRWMFTTFHMGNYQPLTWLTWAFDYELWGLDSTGYHLTSLALHLISTLLFYRFLLILLERFVRAGSARGPAAAGALLFGIHPLRVESVAWATERKDVLCGLFVMLTLLAYLRMDAEEREGRSGEKWRWIAVACFAGSLLSKALGLLLPLVLLALDVYPLRRWTPGRRTRILVEKIPFAALAAVEGILTFQAVRQEGLVRPLASLHPLDRMLQAGYGLCFYLWKSLAPVHLSALYPVPHPFPSGSPALWLSLFAAVGMTAAAVLVRRRFPGLACAWFCYVVLLLPVLGLVNDAPHLVADRYSYLACLPWAALAAVGLCLLSARVAVPRFRRLTEAAIIVALTTLGLLTHLQCGVWRNSLVLWDQALKVDAANPAALNNRGIARAAEHDGSGALRDFTEAIRLDPEFVEAIYNRGCVLADSGDWDGAIRDESEAIRLSPDYGRAYRSRARARRARGDVSGAEADLAAAEGIESSRGPTGHASEIEALNNEGNRLASAGDFGGAIDRYTRALQLGPGIPGVYNNRGNARASRGDHAGAVADYTEALRLEPAFAEAFANRGLSRVFLGDLRAARDDYSEALRLAPGDPDVLANRGGVRNELGDAAGALADFDAALAAAPPGWARTSVVQALIVRLRRR